MSQNKKQKNSNAKTHCSQSENFNLAQDETKNKLLLIPDQTGSKTLPRKRVRSNSSHSFRPLKIASSATMDTNTNPIPIATVSQSSSNVYECSISSSMDFDNITYGYLSEENKDTEEDMPTYNYKQMKQPKFNNPLSTVLSVGFVELDDNHNEIKTAEIQNQDPRTKEECKRIMFLYNSKSGGQKAFSLLKYFSAYTSLIYDLFKLSSSQKEIDKLAYDLAAYQHQIVICIVGGDGSQCWATSLIDRAIRSASKYIAYPTIIPFPVGTGNDLSRTLGWGCIQRTPNKIIKHIADVEYCFNIAKRFSVIDRWNIQYSFSSDYINNTFSPPLPSQFLCYLSIGYDAMITYNFAMQRKNHPEKFKSQLLNQVQYVKMGLKELVRPSNPVNDSIELYINGDLCTNIPTNTRSLKLVNINSAANGVFFWGYLKSNCNELQQWKIPQLDDGLIEVMATHGSSDLVKTKTKMGHAHRLAQCNDIKLKIIKTPCYLQIDGEGWCIDKKCTLHIQLYDQLPTLIGYKYPRGVYYQYMKEYYNDEIKEARHRYRDIVKIKYNIPETFAEDYKLEKIMLNKVKSTDDFDLNIRHEGEKVEEKDKNKKKHRSMSELQLIGNDKKKIKKWKPVFHSWKRNKIHKKDIGK